MANPAIASVSSKVFITSPVTIEEMRGKGWDVYEGWLARRDRSMSATDEELDEERKRTRTKKKRRRRTRRRKGTRTDE
jgi:hypothetical protein